MFLSKLGIGDTNRKDSEEILNNPEKFYIQFGLQMFLHFHSTLNKAKLEFTHGSPG